MNAELLKESFDLIVPRKDEFAHSFYERLFAEYPQTRALFAATDMHRQEAVLVATLATVIAGVRKGDDLVPVLQGLGAKHQGYGATAAHYPAVGTVLLATLHEYLGPEFTPEVENAWVEAYTVISSQMLAGAEALSA